MNEVLAVLVLIVSGRMLYRVLQDAATAFAGLPDEEWKQ